MSNMQSRPNWRQAVVGVQELLQGFNLSEYLYRMEIEGWSLIAIVPIFSKVLVIHRREEVVGTTPDILESRSAVSESDGAVPPAEEGGLGEEAGGANPEAGTWHVHADADA